MFKAFGAQAARVVEITERAMVIHEAMGFARIEMRKDVQDACGRLLMEIHGGRNRNYDSAADYALITHYMHGPAHVGA